MDTYATTPAPPSPPIGSLGRELAKLQEKPAAVALIAAFVVGLAGPWLMLQAVEQASDGDPVKSVVLLWIAAAVSVASLAAGAAVATFLPSALLGRRDRQAMAAHAWIGAREVRRYLGSASNATKIPTTPEEAAAWLATTPDTPALKQLRFEVALMAGRFDHARTIAAEYPRETPFDRYRAAEAHAMIDELQFGQADLAEVNEALAAIPEGIDRSEAITSLAVFEARKLVGRGDWRAPLVAARPYIPGSDSAILARDLGLPMFRVVAPRVVVPMAVFVVAIALFVTWRLLV